MRISDWSSDVCSSDLDQALRPLLTGSGIPLVLAAAEPLASIYRSVNSYAYLAEDTIAGSPEAMTDAQLATRARTILDGIYRDELAAWRSLFETRADQGRRSEEHTSELQSLMRISYAVFCLKKKKISTK